MESFFNILIGIQTSSIAISIEHSRTERPVLSTLFCIIFYLINPSLELIRLLKEFLTGSLLPVGISPKIDYANVVYKES